MLLTTTALEGTNAPLLPEGATLESLIAAELDPGTVTATSVLQAAP